MESKVHRVRYYNPTPRPVNCVSFNKNTKLLAVARTDASIEIWDLNYAPYIVKFIPGVENGSIEALGWVHDRLLSTGLSGALIEWDLDKLCLKNTVLLTGYAAWCLDVNSTNNIVAVGTEQGYLNLYSVENDDIVYKKLFDKQEGRIMCCKFDKTGNTLMTGSVNTIRIWNVETGHAINRISVTRQGKNTIVWCLAVLSDNVIVSGDSHGRLTFWDSAIGDQIESYITHKADILSIAVTDDEKSIYCSGVDPVIVNFVKVNKSSEKQQCGINWVKNVQRNIHEFDVRALVLNEDKLISVGADASLTLSSYPPKWVMRMPPLIPMPRSSVCSRGKLILLRHSNHLEVWKLGSYATNENGKLLFTNISTKQNVDQKDNQQLEQDSAIAIINKATMESEEQRSLKLTENTMKLVSIHTKKKKQMRCCELSPSGEFIAYCTESDIRMLKLEIDEDQNSTSLSKVLITGVTVPCDRVAFSDDSRTMVVHSPGALQVLQVDPEAGATVIQTIPTEKYLKPSILHLLLSMKTSSGATYLVVADTQNAISVWKQNVKKFEHYVTLPKYICVPSAMTIDSTRENLIVTYVDQKIVEYEIANKKFTEWPRTSLPAEWLTRKSAVTSVSAHPKRNALVFQDENSLWILEKNSQDYTREPQAKKVPQGSNLQITLRIIPIKYLAGFHWIGNDEAVTLELLPKNIVMQLLPVIANQQQKVA